MANPANSIGLGLFIARGVVPAHDGEIQASSSIADGTTFTVLLPSGSSSDALA
jgi:signal transduction histidine kinase